MKRLVFAGFVCVVMAVFAGPTGDRPDATHPWAVHDENRPMPLPVATKDGCPPSDAIVLFDGTQSSIDRNWVGNGGKPTKWTVRDGEFVCTPKSGGVGTIRTFADCQLHLEFKVPDPPGPGLGNSGVFLAHYEIQIIDSSVPLAPYEAPWQHANYADGITGAIYGQNPPMVNASRKPGEWQSFDIIFHAAIKDGEDVKDPARMTVFANGVLVQENFALEGKTDWNLRACHARGGEPDRGGIYLQDHGNPVAYRNIWVRELPSRKNVTDSNDLRAELADKTLDLANGTDNLSAKLVWLWESYCYKENAQVRVQIDDCTAAYVEQLRGMRRPLTAEQREEIRNMSLFVDMGVRNHLFKLDDQLVRVVKQMKNL